MNRKSYLGIVARIDPPVVVGRVAKKDIDRDVRTKRKLQKLTPLKLEHVRQFVVREQRDRLTDEPRWLLLNCGPGLRLPRFGRCFPMNVLRLGPWHPCDSPTW